jgi:hypothetical protein
MQTLPALPSAVMSKDDVARELALTPEDFRRRQRRLILTHGFPTPLPGLGLRWARLEVLEWIGAQGHARALLQPKSPADDAADRSIAKLQKLLERKLAIAGAGNVTEIEAARARMAQRYGLNPEGGAA